MAQLIPVTFDFESYWSTDHSLTKMNPIQYVMHPETEIISCAAKIGNEPTYVTFGEDNIRKQFERFDWSDKIAIAHNNEGFDALIAAWRFGIKPAMWLCTQAMARPRYSKTTVIMPDGKVRDGVSLAKLAVEFGLNNKGSLEATNTKGKHLKDFTPQEIEAMREYNKLDVEICYGIFKRLIRETSKDEMRLVDMTIRMIVEPQFELDYELLRTSLAEEQERKHLMLLDTATMIGADVIGLTDDEIAKEISKTLGSANKFASLLRDLGIDPPMKISPTTGKETYALAKTDEAFVALTKHDDPIVSAAANARLGVKSTLLETRIEAFLEAGDAAGGRLPILLKYSGADTTQRWSGWGYNPQNLPRVSGKPSDCLRNSLRAPEGYKVVVADLSGIELRVNHFLWQVPSSMALFQADPEKADLYKDFASALYSVPWGEVTKSQRQVGKVAHLGLGFGAGAATFQKVAKIMAGIDLPLEEAEGIVRHWRTKYHEIQLGWKTCHKALDYIYRGDSDRVREANSDTNWTKFYSLSPDVRIKQAGATQIDPWGLCFTCADGIRTPKGLIAYPNLRQEINDDGKTEWVYGTGRNKARIYAGKVTENIVQHLARCVIAEQALEIRKRYKIALMVHDEIVILAPEDEAKEALDFMFSVMRTPPKWWPELVVWAAGSYGDSYGEAK